MTPSELQARVAEHNRRLVANIRKRADREGNVLGPCLRHYEDALAQDADRALYNLTQHLLDALPETAASIRARMATKWDGDEEKIAASVVNSFRRSAGTNYQALVSFALAEDLRRRGSLWYVAHPVPKAFAESLAIRFTAGVPDTDLADDEASTLDSIPAEEAHAEAFRVTPDVDILIRHAEWPLVEAGDSLEPVLLLSVKTSLADRAGAAARWKTYFDLVTNPCLHRTDRDCAWTRLGITLEQPLAVDITHGIVTANIYKINSDESYRLYGELASGQARANTFMFDLKITTRNDGVALEPPGWSDLTMVPQWLAQVADRNGLSP